MSAVAPSRLASTLLEARLLEPLGSTGVYGQSERFISLAEAVARAVRQAAGAPERLRFGPVMARAEVARLGYFRSFPHLLGSVHCFCGDEAAHRELLRAHDAGGDWSGGHGASDLVMIPAACYPLYPLLARRGEVPVEGWKVAVEAQCFRREPSLDPARMQSFRMQEIVRVAPPDVATAFRDRWIDRGLELLVGWGLDARVEAANDPFFGRAAAVLGSAQRRNALKYELQVVVSDPEQPTACMSANRHQDGFTKAVGLAGPGGAEMHSACVGFGLERVALALLQAHGVRFDRWPRGAARLLEA